MSSQALTPLALGDIPNVVALRLLVISAGTNDPALATAVAVLNQHAVPYDVLDATSTDLTEGHLVASDGSGKYQGVLLTTGGLGYQDASGTWASALSDAEWALLWSYERTYQVRQLTLYTYPGTYPEDYGIRAAGGESISTSATLTAAGQQVFSDLKAGSIPINYAWNYPSTVENVEGLVTTPLVNDASGRVLAVQSNTSDGRERLALTVDHSPYLLHSQLLSYGLVSWLTKGLYLGEFRRYLHVDVDDWFLDDDLWKVDPLSPDDSGYIEGTFRISAKDALAARAQQDEVRRTYPVASNFKLAVPFNAGGANTSAPNTCTPGPTSVDPLSSVSRCMDNTFDWVNHSRDHLSMDCANYTTAYQQFNGNFNRAKTLGLKFSGGVGVSGEHSGLGWHHKTPEGTCLDYDKTDYTLAASNLNFLKGAFDSGIRYLGSNRSVASHWDRTCLSCGVVHPLRPALFLVPRWPTNIFYYATTPAEVKSSYNKVYGPKSVTAAWSSNLSYPEILEQEAEIAAYHVLSGSVFPHYMHQTNLREYEAGKSLVFDWMKAVLNRYSQYSTLPLKTLLWKDLGAHLKQRTSFIKTSVSGSWNRTTNTITLLSPTAVEAFVTGTRAGTAETYGPTIISRVSLSANTPATFTIQK